MFMRIILTIVKLVVSAGFLASGYYLFTHGSSAAFELGAGCVVAGLFHWVFWPDVRLNKS